MDALLAQLFIAENTRNWRVFESLLHREVEWTLVEAGETTVIHGRAQYMDRMLAAYESDPEASFDVRRSCRNEAGLVVTELVDKQGRVSFDVFDIRDGVVRREWEFLLGEVAQ